LIQAGKKGLALASLAIAINLEYALALVYGVLAARWLGPADLGLMRVINSALAIGLALAGLRADQAIPRFVALHRGDPKAQVDYARAGTRMSLIGAVVMAAALGSASPLLPGVAEISATGMLTALALTLPFTVFLANVDQYYLGAGAVRMQVAFVLVSASQYCRLLLATRYFGIDGWAFAKFALPVLFAGTLMWVHRNWFRKPERQAAYGDLARFAWPLWIAGLSDAVLISIDALALAAILRDPAAIGHFGIASLFFVSCQQMFKPVQRHFFPLVGAERDPDRYRQVVRTYGMSLAAVALLLFGIGYLLGPTIVEQVFGEAFGPAGPLVGIIAWALLARAIALFSRTVLQLHGVTAPIMAVTLVGAAGHILLNVLLVTNFGVVGAAYAVVGSQAAVAAMCLGYGLYANVFVRAIARQT